MVRILSHKVPAVQARKHVGSDFRSNAFYEFSGTDYLNPRQVLGWKVPLVACNKEVRVSCQRRCNELVIFGIRRYMAYLSRHNFLTTRAKHLDQSFNCRGGKSELGSLKDL